MGIEWKEAQKQLPECNPRHESDFLLCIDMAGYDVPFVAWFNCKHETWTTALLGSSNDAITVTHWQELPEMPT